MPVRPYQTLVLACYAKKGRYAPEDDDHANNFHDFAPDCFILIVIEYPFESFADVLEDTLDLV